MNHRTIVRWSLPALALLLAACTVNATATLPGSGAASTAQTGTGNTTNPAAPATQTNPGGTTTPAAQQTPASAGNEPAPSATTGDETGPKETEPNNDFDAANVLPLGQWLMGTAGKDEEGDYFKVSTPAGKQAGWLEVTVEENNNDYAPWLKIYSSTKKGLEDKYTTRTETPFSVKVRANPDALYYVNLNDGEGNPYKLQATFTPVADPSEPNNDFDQATPLELGKKIQFATFQAADAEEEDDVDMFRCTLPADKATLRVKITNKTTSQNPDYYWVKIYDSSKARVFDKYWGNRQDIDHDFAGEAGQEYYIAITSGDSNDALSELVVTAE